MSSKKPFLIHSFNKHILRAYYATNTVLGHRNSGVNKHFKMGVLVKLTLGGGYKHRKLKYSVIGSDKCYGKKQRGERDKVCVHLYNLHTI